MIVTDGNGGIKYEGAAGQGFDQGGLDQVRIREDKTLDNTFAVFIPPRPATVSSGIKWGRNGHPGTVVNIPAVHHLYECGGSRDAHHKPKFVC